MPQHRVGCRICGAKSSSRFREWCSYAEHEGFQGVEFRVPKSGVICNNCYTSSMRNTLKVCATVCQFACSSPLVLLLQSLMSIFLPSAELSRAFRGPLALFHDQSHIIRRDLHRRRSRRSLTMM